MPIYVYQCDKCGLTFERKQAVTEAHLTDCPECDGHVRRVLQPVGVVFKGSGWYVTDHRPKNANGGAVSHSRDKVKDSSTSVPSAAAAADGSESKAAAKDTLKD